MDHFADSIECPNCAELIKKNAKACRFCNHGLSNDHYRNCIACDERIKIQAKLCRFCGASDVAIPRVKVPEQLPSGVYGTSIKQQVFEVILRQAMAGAPWKEICKGPMKVNDIDPKEIEEELKRRQAGLSDRDQNGDASKNASGFPYETIDEEIEKVIELEQNQEKQKKKNKDKKSDEKGKSKRKNKPKDEENKE